MIAGGKETKNETVFVRHVDKIEFIFCLRCVVVKNFLMIAHTAHLEYQSQFLLYLIYLELSRWAFLPVADIRE
jgi:hypothetical protein